MPQITVLTGSRHPEAQSLGKIADVLKVTPAALKVNRTKQALGYMTIDVASLESETRKELQALDVVASVI